MSPIRPIANGAYLLGCWLAVSVSSAAAAAVVVQTLSL